VLQQRSEHAALQQQLTPYLAAAGLSQEQLLWALAVTRSRAFAAPHAVSPLRQLGLKLGFGGGQQRQSQQQQQHVLTPLIDLVNHSSAVQVCGPNLALATAAVKPCERLSEPCLRCPLNMAHTLAPAQSECEFVPNMRNPAFRVVATNAWMKGAEVLINYGSSSNDALLQLYGFVEPGNPSDRCGGGGGGAVTLCTV
jgi:hypothetical protein